MSNFDPIFIILCFSKEDGKGFPNLLKREGRGARGEP